MTQLLLRFLIGGAVVSSFALLGDIVRPKSFAGIFGGAPSVALATGASCQEPVYRAGERGDRMVADIGFVLVVA